jgi:hypothetical protein
MDKRMILTNQQLKLSCAKRRQQNRGQTSVSRKPGTDHGFCRNRACPYSSGGPKLAEHFVAASLRRMTLVRGEILKNFLDALANGRAEEAPAKVKFLRRR